MKLLSLTSFYLAVLSLLIFFLMGTILFVTLRSASDREADARLLQEKTQVLGNPELLMVATMANLPFHERLSFRVLDTTGSSAFQSPIDHILFDSLYADTIANTRQQARFLRFYGVVQGDPVEFTLRNDKLSSTEVIKRISIATTLLSILFIWLIFIINRLGFKRLWSGFFDTLKAVRRYGPEQKALMLAESGILEFQVLNRTIEKMTARTSEMYSNLQDFTAHTTHELQTPLAVIRSKTELLLQTPGLTCDQLDLIRSIEENARHLSQLNRSLSLLFKIGNQRVPEGEGFVAAPLIRQSLENLEAHIEAMNLKIRLELDEETHLPADPPMGAILIQNLIKNAIVHNILEGSIDIRLENGSFRVRNTGTHPERPPQDFFTEFVKGPASKGLGLGLSLVRKVAQVNQLAIDYQYESGFHTFCVTWPEKNGESRRIFRMSSESPPNFEPLS
ncbi:MAG: HAMP domain-containing sensor histidine kinase [Bacteroidales bacterium]